MQADFSIELGAQDDAMEMPWSSADGNLRYYDLKRRPELLLELSEAFQNKELGEFLASSNSTHSILETSKCDAWLTNEWVASVAVTVWVPGVWKVTAKVCRPWSLAVNV